MVLLNNHMQARQKKFFVNSVYQKCKQMALPSLPKKKQGLADYYDAHFSTGIH
jgi:hypothetical protein